MIVLDACGRQEQKDYETDELTFGRKQHYVNFCNESIINSN